jgi:hypothetical protein
MPKLSLTRIRSLPAGVKDDLKNPDSVFAVDAPDRVTRQFKTADVIDLSVSESKDYTDEQIAELGPTDISGKISKKDLSIPRITDLYEDNSIVAIARIALDDPESYARFHIQIEQATQPADAELDLYVSIKGSDNETTYRFLGNLDGGCQNLALCRNGAGDLYLGYTHTEGYDIEAAHFRTVLEAGCAIEWIEPVLVSYDGNFLYKFTYEEPPSHADLVILDGRIIDNKKYLDSMDNQTLVDATVLDNPESLGDVIDAGDGALKNWTRTVAFRGTVSGISPQNLAFGSLSVAHCYFPYDGAWGEAHHQISEELSIALYSSTEWTPYGKWYRQGKRNVSQTSYTWTDWEQIVSAT